MKIENSIKDSFSVIGKEGSTEDGPGLFSPGRMDSARGYIWLA